MINIGIVEDNSLMVALLERIISSNEDMQHIFSIGNVKEAIHTIEKNNCNINAVLMDIELPDGTGIDIIKKLKPKFPFIEFIICTSFDNDEYVFKGLEVGASAYILKTDDPKKIIESIINVIQGKSSMSPEIARKVINYFIKKDAIHKSYHITDKEDKILQLLSSGKTYIEIADKLSIAINTVKTHIYNIYEKLNVDNRVEAINKYFNNKY